MTQLFREKNPNTKIGSPGRFQVVRSELNLVSHEVKCANTEVQGFNSGVTLYHLGRMRESQDWEVEVVPERMKEIAHQFIFAGTVGDQDWLTVVGWVRPDLFHLLACNYNVQRHEGVKMIEHKERWASYRNCSSPDHPDTKIIHKTDPGDVSFRI